MEDYKSRVIAELSDLTGKATALANFTASDGAFTTLPLEEKLRLLRQLSIMTDYRAVLIERISAF